MQIAGQDAELPEIRRRARLLGLVVVVFLLVVLGRLFQLQVVQGDQFYRITTDSMVRTQRLPAVRGKIRDRKGRLLAGVRPSYDVFVAPRQTSATSFARLRDALRLDSTQAADAWERVEKERRQDRDRLVEFARDVSHEAMAALETSLELAGVKVVAVPRRHYPYGALAAHLLGFMNEVSDADLRNRRDEGYRPGDLIGRSGVERQWEAYLRGRPGFKKVIVDGRGFQRADVQVGDLVEGPVEVQPVIGNDLTLTIDVEVQRILERALRAHRAAAAVVMDVDSGRILGIASRPTFDPNVMSSGLTAAIDEKLRTDPFRPLRDRAVSETFNPGSTFKVVSALAALGDRILTPKESTKCKGFVERGRRRFRCGKSHGKVSLVDAIIQSCNVYFYELGERPGMMDRMAHLANELGLGAPTGLGLNGEEGGLIPTQDWYDAQQRENPKHEGFMIGHALNAAIGEGAARVTVLQMATLYAAIANGGQVLLPQIVERIETPAGQVLERFEPRVRRQILFSPENLDVVRQGLWGVVHDRRGTAYAARGRGVEVAGKTGTAQVQKVRTKPGEPPRPAYLENDHAWFAGYAPASRPRIAFAVLVEHGGHGGDVAAPVAMEIANRYFESVDPEAAKVPRFGAGSARGLGARAARDEPAAPSAAAEPVKPADESGAASASEAP